MTRSSVVFALAIALGFGGCGGSTPSSSTMPGASASASPAANASPSQEDPVNILVIGDSVPDSASFCPSCTGFARLYQLELMERTAATVMLQNRSRNDSAGMAEIETQLAEDALLVEQLGEADVVIISIGFNNLLPDSNTSAMLEERYGGDWGCRGEMGDTVESYVTWALATTAECVRAQRDAYAGLYDTLFSTIVELQRERPVVDIALNVYDANLRGRDIEESDTPPEQVAELWPWMIDVYDRWNEMLCDRAVAHGFVCVDIYHAFNGPNADKPIGSLSIDGAHPSQTGNDLIADLLAEVDVSSVLP